VHFFESSSNQLSVFSINLTKMFTLDVRIHNFKREQSVTTLNGFTLKTCRNFASCPNDDTSNKLRSALLWNHLQSMAPFLHLRFNCYFKGKQNVAPDVSHCPQSWLNNWLINPFFTNENSQLLDNNLKWWSTCKES